MNWLLRLLFDWVFVMLYYLMEGILYIVYFLEKVFDVFAGTTKITYNGQKDYLINVFFGQNVISTVFWGITAIAMTLCFAFTIVAVARKTVDFGGTVKNSIGQIISNAGMACISFLLLSVISIAAINLSNVVLVQLNYLMKNAYGLSYTGAGENKEFSQEELASMTRIMNTVGNYSLNPSPQNRYNVNACFNACRSDLFRLYSSGFFSYNYQMDGDHHTWQSAIYQLGSSADFKASLPEDQYNETVSLAVSAIMDELKYNPNFKPVKYVEQKELGELSVDTIIFLTASMDAPWSSFYKDSASFTDPLRRSYYDGTKEHSNLKTVRKDFDIWLIRYEIAFLSSFVFVLVMVQCTFIFITRLVNLMLLYVVSPFFVSSMPLDDGQRFQTWRQAFIIQLLSGFGTVVAMRLYLLMIPMIMDSKLIFFENVFFNYMARLLFILGGSFAVLKSTSMITSILAGTPGAAAQGELVGAALGMSAVNKIKGAAQKAGHVAGAPASIAAKQGIHHVKKDRRSYLDAKRSQRTSEKMERKGHGKQSEKGSSGSGGGGSSSGSGGSSGDGQSGSAQNQEYTGKAEEGQTRQSPVSSGSGENTEMGAAKKHAVRAEKHATAGEDPGVSGEMMNSMFSSYEKKAEKNYDDGSAGMQMKRMFSIADSEARRPKKQPPAPPKPPQNNK